MWASAPWTSASFQRLVGVFVFDVLADDADRDFVLRVVDAMDQFFPRLHVPLFGLEVQVLQHQRVHTFVREDDGHFVDRGDVFGGDDGFVFDVAEQGDLRLDVFGEEAVGAAEQDVGLNSDAEQFFDRVLGGLGLEFLGGGDERHQRDVDEERVLTAKFLAHLADGFDERQGLDVADRAADFDDGHVDFLRHLLHGSLDFVGDVRDDLHGLAEVVAAALLGDDLLVDAAGGPVIVARQAGVGEAFVVAEVEVGFGAIVGDEDFAVLEGRHGARIDVQIRVELHEVDLEPAAFEQAADGSCRQSLAQRRHNSARHEDVLCRHPFLALSCFGKLCRLGCTIDYARKILRRKWFRRRARTDASGRESRQGFGRTGGQTGKPDASSACSEVAEGRAARSQYAT